MNKHQPPLAQESIKCVASHNCDAVVALREISDGLRGFEAAFVFIFFPQSWQGAGLAAAIKAEFPDQDVYGFSTAGQITPAGYEADAVLAIAYSRAHFRYAAHIFEPLIPFSLKAVSDGFHALCERFEHCGEGRNLGLLFTDGLSKQEDLLIATLHACQPDLPIFGGSVADGLRFEQTFIYANGKLHQNAALLLVIQTDLDFEMIEFSHFSPTEKKVVITEADPNMRVVKEINGAPAAQEYADVIGCDVEALSPEIFAKHPMLLHVGKKYYVRSIQEVTPDGGLSFLSSIDKGLILTIGEGTEIIDKMDAALQKLWRENTSPEFIFGFDCVLRRLEIEGRDRVDAASEIWRKHGALGFNTYGEQHHGMHVNQTFVGIAFYKKARQDKT